MNGSFLINFHFLFIYTQKRDMIVTDANYLGQLDAFFVSCFICIICVTSFNGIRNGEMCRVYGLNWIRIKDVLWWLLGGILWDLADGLAEFHENNLKPERKWWAE